MLSSSVPSYLVPHRSSFLSLHPIHEHLQPMFLCPIFKQKLVACVFRPECSPTQPVLLYSYVHNPDIYSDLSYLRVITLFGVFYWFTHHGCYIQTRGVDDRTTAPTASSCVRNVFSFSTLWPVSFSLNYLIPYNIISWVSLPKFL
jgi:hypothetical protein